MAKKVKEAIEKDSSLKAEVKKLTGAAKDPKKDQQKGSGSEEANLNLACVVHNRLLANSALSSISLLYNSFIYDSGSTTHVCNDRQRFSEFRTANDVILVGDTQTSVEGYGTVTIWADPVVEGKPKVKFDLFNCAFVPGFHTSLVSADLGFKKGIFWDTKRHVLTVGDVPACRVSRHHGLWTLEYNPVQSVNVVPEMEGKNNAKKGENNEKIEYVNDTGELWTHFSIASDSEDVSESGPDDEKMVFHSRTKVSANQRISKGTYSLFHRRLGHLNDESLKLLSRNALGISIIGDPIKNEDTGGKIICEACELAKAKRQVSRRTSPANSRPFKRLHFDLIQMSEAYNGDKWVAHFLDDATAMHFVYTLARKSGLNAALKHLYAYVQTQYDAEIEEFRTDGETALGNEFKEFTSEKGIRVLTSAPSTQSQNGPAGRSGAIIIMKARVIRIEANLPADLWPEAVRTAVYLMNRTPTNRLEGGKTPWEVLTRFQNEKKGIKNAPDPRPDLSHIRIFGSKAYARKPNIPKKEKMEPRALIGYLVGYKASNIFRIWVPRQGKVIEVRDVVFDETKLYDSNHPFLEDRLKKSSPRNDVLVEIPRIPQIEFQGVADESDSDDSEVGTNGREGTGASEEREVQDVASESISEPIEGGLLTPDPTPTPDPDPQPQVSRDSEPGPRCPTKEIRGDVDESNIIEGTRVRKPSARRREAHLISVEKAATDLTGFLVAFPAGLEPTKEPLKRFHRNDLPPEPKNWRQMVKHPHRDGFMKAAHREFTELNGKGTFRPVVRPKNEEVIPLTWTYLYKFDTEGYLLKYKSRLCVRGDLQRFGLADTYAATLALRTFRAMMAILAAFDLDAEQWDVVNAFVNAYLDETVYVEYPQGFEQEGMVLLLLKALYGLRRSPRLWQKHIKKTLVELGLQQATEDGCLYSNDYLLVLFFVDDFVTICHPNHRGELVKFKEALLQRYEMRDFGELNWFLGIRIVRDRQQRKLWLCQDSYVDKITHRYHLEDMRPPRTPMSPATVLERFDGQATAKEIHLYQQKGSLLYAAIVTRPDVAGAASKLSEHLLNPSPKHFEAVDKAISYLYGTRTLAIEYSVDNTSSKVFTCASDAAFGDNPDRKSSQGYLFKLFGGPVDWKAGKQKTVTTSTTEAELLAVSNTAKETFWWQRMFRDIGFELDHNVSILCDNSQTVGILMKDEPELHTKLRHVDIHHHWLRQETQAKRIVIEWIPTAHMPADGFTKSLSVQRHREFVRMLGLTSISGILQE
jgi:hypothetical protein